jgi:hypothetical protein
MVGALVAASRFLVEGIDTIEWSNVQAMADVAILNPKQFGFI